ncbi:30S ribosomal protein S9 [Verrucomicrobia bacterium SCGC AG-212-E04]|nr:30S ribosomal protein S9 [Verrucomicrobia bacterium SCGC AG-212-E04]
MSTETPIIATGRRKTAVARVTMSPGEGKITINNRSFEDYLPSIQLQNTVLKPLEIANVVKNFNFVVNATGGGVAGQAGAIRLGIARALLVTDPTLRPALKAEGMLTRDSRMKERKKSGQPGARKRFQFSKR